MRYLRSCNRRAPQGQTEELPVDNNLENPELGKRTVPFTREIYIEAIILALLGIPDPLTGKSVLNA